LGLKYGADPSEAHRLLAAAKSLGLRVVGVSFHVGSSCKNLGAFERAISSARAAFDQGLALGHDMRLLDIGGGFTGRFDQSGCVVISEIARAVNAAVNAHFPVEGGVRLIAEPGRYFAEASAVLAVRVNGVRERCTGGDGAGLEYWLSDGVYGGRLRGLGLLKVCIARAPTCFNGRQHRQPWVGGGELAVAHLDRAGQGRDVCCTIGQCVLGNEF
jgi:ornithine decarboxylase